ncbi:MAG TPA: cation:proton antiporter [Candidatus Paceibacterota bacterium]|nr:cation:proton antiporter [Verrucomicrobiota bacterium]HRZ47189.1 cation:proton antiporter [Candidatus Paceibacterota bacterium]
MIAIDFIQDFAVVVLLAAGIGWLCQRIGLPVVLGYLTVGILVGPHAPSLALITDPGRIQTLAQLGLVFLIFSVGQGLRLQRLIRTGWPLILATVLIAIIVLNICRMFGAAMGWPAEHGIVLAALFMVSSTAIIGKSLHETNTLHAGYGQTALAVTALDDLVAVVMLTVLTSMVQAGNSDPVTVLGTVFRLNAVLISLVIVALLAVPPLLRALGRRAVPEVQTLFVVGLLLLMALLSAKSGFSAALGAFVLGAIVSSAGLTSQVERAMPGLCDVFGAVFFVAMGMLFDFEILVRVWPLALGLFVLAILGRFLASSFALIAVGQPPGDSLKAGISLTAIGEFTLILAMVAVEGGIAPASFYSIAVALCLLTAATTPVLIRHAPAIAGRIERLEPERIRLWISLYHDWIGHLRQRQRAHRLWQAISPRLVQMAVQLLLISGLLLLAAPLNGLVRKWLGPEWPAPHAMPILFWLLFGALILAPLVALWRQIEAVSMICADAATQGRAHRAVFGPLFQIFLQIAAGTGTGLWLATLLPLDLLSGWPLVLLSLLLAALAAVLWRSLIRWHSQIEIELRSQLADAPFGLPSAITAETTNPHRWQIRAADILIRPGSRAVRRSIRQLPFRDRFSCTVVAIDRQGVSLRNPSPDTMLFPQDKLLLMGRDEDLRRADRWLNTIEESDSAAADDLPMGDLSLQPLEVPRTSKHLGKPLAELAWGAHWAVQVVGIERDNTTVVSPGPSDALQPGDQLLVLGAPDQIRELAFWLST